jgi:hypothetical protein
LCLSCAKRRRTTPRRRSRSPRGRSAGPPAREQPITKRRCRPEQQASPLPAAARSSPRCPLRTAPGSPDVRRGP